MWECASISAGITVLPREVDAGGAGGPRDVTSSPDAREAAVLDEKRGALDRRAAVTGNETRAFVKNGIRLRHLRVGVLYRRDRGEREVDSGECAHRAIIR